ncbi:MAG: O-antigen ligase family protein [Candidatus Bipolaricaulaceae bacterium]
MPKKRKTKGKKPSLPARLRLGLLVFLLLSQPLVFSAWNTEYGYTKSIYTLILVGVILTLWAWEILRSREAQVEVSGLSPILVGLLVAALLSALSGRTPLCVVLQSAAMLLGFGFVYLSILNTPEHRHPWVLGALLASAFLNALLGLLQYLGAAPGGAAGKGPSAMVATMGNQQFLAGFLSYSLLPALIFLGARRGWLLASAVVGFNFSVMLLTQQIGVRLGLGAALLFISFGTGFWRVKLPVWPKLVGAGALALAALGGVLGFSGVVAGLALASGVLGLHFLGRAVRRWPLLWGGVVAGAAVAVVLLLPVTTPLAAVRDLWARKSGAVRAWDWWVGYEMWRDHPLLGVGLGGYKILFVPYKPEFLSSPRGAGYAFPFPRADQAHNEYVQVAAELGTFGALVLLAGLGLVGYVGVGRLRRLTDEEKRWELLLLGAGLITVFVHAAPTFPFHLPASSLAFVVLLGLAFSPRYGPFGDLRVRLARGWREIWAALLLAFAVAGGVLAVRDVMADGYLLAAQAAYYLGDLKRAEENITRSVNLDFCPRVSLYWYGLIKAGLGKLEEAQEALEGCLSCYRPETLYLNLASVHLQLGQPARAKPLLQELLATLPLPEVALEARYYLAVAELQGGNVLAAKAQLEEILREAPETERAWLLLGEVQRRRYLWDEAKAALTRALQIIEKKLHGIQEKLSRPLPLQNYGELRAQKEGLEKMRAQALQSLAELP